ncbi:MAG: glucosaminidase domain-containing protein [Phycisphaerales bacterium]|nr:glucosaminidase domain-containing protein [Phycisphaerales bacterium]
MVLQFNKYKIFLCALVLMLWGHASFGQGVGEKYVEKYAPIASSLMLRTGIPASVILGVSMIESGMGKSKNCRLLNNFFGVKGKNHLSKSKSHHHSAYKQYPNAEASFSDFARVIKSKKYYLQLKGNMDYKKWLHTMNQYGYAEAKGLWIKDITIVIKRYKLYQFDKEHLNIIDDNAPFWGYDSSLNNGAQH